MLHSVLSPLSLSLSLSLFHFSIIPISSKSKKMQRRSLACSQFQIRASLKALTSLFLLPRKFKVCQNDTAVPPKKEE
jgi:hypothetical protein